MMQQNIRVPGDTRTYDKNQQSVSTVKPSKRDNASRKTTKLTGFDDSDDNDIVVIESTSRKPTEQDIESLEEDNFVEDSEEE